MATDLNLAFQFENGLAFTENNIAIFSGSGDPNAANAGAGTPAPRGSLFLRDNGELYIKSGEADNSWNWHLQSDDVVINVVQPAAGLTISGAPIQNAGTLTFSLANDLAALEGLSGTGFAARTGADTWVVRNIQGVTGNIDVSNINGVTGNPTINLALAGDSGTWGTATTVPVFTTDAFGRVVNVLDTPIALSLTALTDVTISSPSSGQILQFNGSEWVNVTQPTAAGTVTSVAATAPAAGFTISGSPITTSGTLTFALANDLAAVEGLSGTGIAARISADTWAVRTLTGTTNQITVTNGDASAGNPTLSIPTTFVAPGSLQYTTNFGYPIETIAATGIDQAGATEVSVTTTLVGSGALNSGVRLPSSPFAGEIHCVTNNTTNQIYVYPAVGQTIDSQAVNTPAFISPGLAISFAWDGTHWVTIQDSISPNTGIDIDVIQGNVVISNTGVLTFSAGTTGLTPATATSGNITLGGTLAIANGGTGANSPTSAFDNLAPTISAGDLIYHNGSDNVRLAIGTNTQVLSVSGGLPVWINQSAINAGTATTATSATTATNLAGGTAGAVPYQTGAGTTTFLSAGTSSQVLVSGTTPSWVSVATALGYTPVNTAGDTMTGFLTLNADPTSNLHAATKQYVDSVASGLIWRDPIEITNVITDSGGAPGSPVSGDAYIIGTGQNTGAWSSFAVGDVVQYQGSSWVFIKALAVGDRFGVSFVTATAGAGSFATYDNYIVTVSGGTPGSWTYSFEAPVNNWAVNVSNENALLYAYSFAYSSDQTKWIQIASATTYEAGTGLSLTGRTFANTGVLSNAAGAGISVSASTGAVTITNTGVTSVTAGAGISVSASTGAVTISATSTTTSSVKTANYTITSADYTILADGTSSGFTVTLPASPVADEIHNVKKIDETRSKIILSGNGNNIDKYTSVTIDVPFMSIAVQWNATSARWHII